jgi:hypothetical protein
MLYLKKIILRFGFRLETIETSVLGEDVLILYETNNIFQANDTFLDPIPYLKILREKFGSVFNCFVVKIIPIKR